MYGAAGVGESSLECGEGIDDRRRFERPVPLDASA